MEDPRFTLIRQAIIDDPMNREMRERGYQPLYVASPDSRIVLIGQAPGRKAQESMRPWNDASGVALREWLGVTADQFYDPALFAILPMDFYYPGKGAGGDLPPRKGFAATWHPRLLAHMPGVQLTILIGAYAQKHYLGSRARANLTETVRSYREYLPEYLPLVHSSPLNFRWHLQHPWFAQDVIPDIQAIVGRVLDDESG